jgi:hypothetical protein
MDFSSPRGFEDLRFRGLELLKAVRNAHREAAAIVETR